MTLYRWQHAAQQECHELCKSIPHSSGTQSPHNIPKCPPPTIVNVQTEVSST